jgi:CRP/FNR family transcriptional regulator, nitrogen fixation regulation protein
MLPQFAVRAAVRPEPSPQIPQLASQVVAERRALGQWMQTAGTVMPFSRNSEIFGENEPAEYIYHVQSGSVRTYKIFSDGRRQIMGFYLPGEIFGLEFDQKHTLSAEAITDAKVVMVKRSAVTAAARDPAIGFELFALTGRELQRMHDRVLLLVKRTQERVASFVLEVAERGASGNVVELPMARRDIADYLGLTPETVSRVFAGLEGAAAIEMPSSRCIVLRNRSLLNKLKS